MPVDVSSFSKAVARLGEILQRYASDPSDSDIRDGLIQRFEFTFDLAPKMLRRVMAATNESEDLIDRMTFPTLMRTAFEQGFIDDPWPRWKRFRDMRNTTSHTYDEAKAQRVADAIPEFLAEVRELAGRLEEAARQT